MRTRAQADLQVASLRLLSTLAHFSHDATERLARQGLVQTLLAVLPSPTPAPPAAAEGATLPARGSGAGAPPEDGQQEEPQPLDAAEGGAVSEQEVRGSFLARCFTISVAVSQL